MAIVPKLLTDHVLIQFAHGAEHQLQAPGEIEGAQIVEIEYLIDDTTGQVVGKTNNPNNGKPQPIDADSLDKIKDLLGKKFAAVAAQLGDAQKKIAEMEAAAQAEKIRTDEVAAAATQAAEDAAKATAAAIESHRAVIAGRDAIIASRDAVIAGLNNRLATIAGLTMPAVVDPA